jgi:hypothetical protein
LHRMFPLHIPRLILLKFLSSNTSQAAVLVPALDMSMLEFFEEWVGNSAVLSYTRLYWKTAMGHFKQLTLISNLAIALFALADTLILPPCRF